jgi:hypothetical protein
MGYEFLSDIRLTVKGTMENLNWKEYYVILYF